MDSQWLLMWVLVFLLQCLDCSQVTRQKSYDIVIPDQCFTAAQCLKYGANCTKKLSAKRTCCKKCQCQSGMTFYKKIYQKKLVQACLLDPSKNEGCKYHLNAKKDFDSVKLKKKTVVELGKLAHSAAKIYSWTCKIVTKQYWNLRAWKNLTIGGKKNIYIEERNLEHYVKMNIPKKNTTLYQGLLIKLQIHCKKSENKDENSCVIFKIVGSRKYAASPVAPPITPTPTKNVKKGKKKSILTTIIIAVAALVLIVLIILALCCWRRRRKTKLGNGGFQDASKRGLIPQPSDPNYHNPSSHMPGRHSSEMGSSANNLTYLQPIDGGWQQNGRPSEGKHKKKKKNDPNYDYPNVENMSRKSDYRDDISNQKPIYAEVSEIQRDVASIKPRPISGGVVGLPGYQPPTGIRPPQGDYSSLGVASSADTSTYQSLLEASDKPPEKGEVDWAKNDGPPSPKYAEVVPEENIEVNI